MDKSELNLPTSHHTRQLSKSLNGMIKHIKCVLVGDKGTHKTKLIIKYTLGEDNTCRTDRGTTDAMDNYNANVKIDDQLIHVDLWDVADNETFVDLRSMCYSGAHIVLLFFNVVDPESATHMKEKWAREVTLVCPTAPFVVVGTHADERDLAALQGKHVVTKEQGEQLANDVGAAAYIETTTAQPHQSKMVFERAIRLALNDQHVGMRARLKYVDEMLEKQRLVLKKEHDAVNLALWRGQNADTNNLSSTVSKTRTEVAQWEEAKKYLTQAAKADPSAKDESLCSIQ